jgi:DNA-binding protein H-NS
LNEYQRIADRAAALLEAKPATDPSVVSEIKKLAEKAVDLRHKQLTVSKQATPQQIERYEAISAKFQAALHAVCPTCPKRQ